MKISIDYKKLIVKLEQDIKEGLLQLDDSIKIVRDDKGIVIDYYSPDNIPEGKTEDIVVSGLLRELHHKNALFDYIPLKDWAFINNIQPITARKKALNGKIKSAFKFNGDWYVDPYEVNVDHRFADGNRNKK